MKILVIDDEKRQLDYLELLLNRIYPEGKITTTQDPIAALDKLNKFTFDLVFLDVEMPEMTGLELVAVAGVDNLPPLIFTTAFSKYAVDAFKVNAIDYLLKPVAPDDLSRALEKVTERIAYSQQKASLKRMLQSPESQLVSRIVLPEGQLYSFVNFEDIIYIQGSGSYATFYLINEQKKTASKRLNVYWKQLECQNFMRCHQSFVVNLKHVKGYDRSNGGEIIMSNNNRVPISNNQKNRIKEVLGV